MPLSLFRRSPGGPYYVRGTVARGRVYESTGLRDKRQAQAWANRREAQLLERHALGPRATYTFAEAALAYLQAGGEGRFLGPILDHFGPDQKLAEIDNAALHRAAAALYPQAAPATVNRQLITPVSAIANLAAENGLAEARRFRRLRARGIRTRWLDPAEAERLLEAAAPHLRPILAALLGGGCRVSEALAVRAEDWHAATGEIWIAESKNGWPRMAQVPARARDMILEGTRGGPGPLFRTPKGDAYTLRRNGGGQIEAAFKRAREAAGLGPEVTPHVLRHTWATWYCAATRDFGRMLDLGGWRTPATAERYRKAAPADLAGRLVAHGWTFDQLGRDLPPIADPGAEPGAVLRLVK